MRDHFNKTKDVKTMYGGAKLIEKLRWRTYFVSFKKKKNFSSLCNDKVTSVLYWLRKEEVALCKLSSLQKLVESFGVVEMAIFKK